MGTFGKWTAYGTFGNCLRLSFHISNLIAAIISLVSVGFGMYMVITRRPYAALVQPQLYVHVGFILVVIGFMAFVSCVIGFYAVSRELRCVIYAFAVANALIFVMLLIGGVMGFIFRYQLVEQTPLHLKMLSSLRELYGMDNQADLTHAWDKVQANLKCCGVNGSQSDLRVWRTSKWYMRQEHEPKYKLPVSCCRVGNNGEVIDKGKCVNIDLRNPDESLVYTETCYEPLQTDLLHISLIGASLGIATSILLLIPAAFGAGYASLIQK